MDTSTLYEQMVPELTLLKTAQKLSEKLEQLDADLIATLEVPHM